MKPERISEIDGQPLELWRQHLLDAAAYIDEHGYCKDRCCDNDGRVCTIGAVLYSRPLSSGVELIAVEERVARYLQLSFGPGRAAASSVADWNDRPETTKEMAVNALSGAALSK